MSRLPFEGVSKNSRIKPGHWKFGPKSCLLAGEKFSFSFKADRSEKRECWELYSSDGEVTAIKPGHQESEQATWKISVEKAPGARPGGLPWSQQELEENSGPCSSEFLGKFRIQATEIIPKDREAWRNKDHTVLWVKLHPFRIYMLRS